jgi:HlyD family secretion protein
MKALAKERGIELPAGRFGGGSGGGDANSPVTRTLYRLIDANTSTARPEPVTVKLGISDGASTEVLEGLNEGDLVITSAVIPGAKPTSVTNPFGGGQRRGF